MSSDAGGLFTKLLHLEEPWRVTSVNVNEEQTRVDIRVVYDGTPEMVCGCGCIRKCHDLKEREW